jgi:Ca2+-transporting ATPase
MVTGDHPATALTVAHRVGFEGARVATGKDLDHADPSGLRRLVGEVDVFARVNPEHKLRIVEALQAGGEIVAMTGDGVNDAPALKRSDVGIAMGQRGSDVSREVADLILLDDNFATIVGAVEEGRSIYENIQKFIRFLFSTNLSELLVVGIGALAAFLLNIRDSAGALLLPLTAAQILWINLISDGAPALVLGLDKNPGVMDRSPRPPAAPLLDRPSLRFVGYAGSLMAVLAFGILMALPWLGESRDLTRSATFVFLAACQLLFAYPARRSEMNPLPSRSLHLVILASFAFQIMVVLFAPFRNAFDMVALTPVAWTALGFGILIAWGMADGLSRWIWRRPA